ncbi:MAG: hypothetical protein IPI41_14270 [Flavobacteriales bacterium]|nr:hypothetical protein [Flavobacteriales bacterium]
MRTSSDRQVDITESGRAGTVTYRDGAGTLSFYWEFGGGDVVAIIQVNDAAAWSAGRSWNAGERAGILRFVADEVIRRKAPGCRAEIDEGKGEILLRQVGTPPPPRGAPDVTFVRKLSSLKAMLGIVVLVGTLLFGGVMWFKEKVLSIDPGKGVPLGLCVRTDTHIATLIQTLEAYTPSLHRDGSKDRFTVSIFIVPLDGSGPKLIPIAEEKTFSSYQLAKVLGSDGRTLWFDVNGIGGVDLKTYELLKPSEVRDPNLPATASPLAPSVGEYLSAGYHTSAGNWLGLHSPAELQGEFAPKKFVRRVVRQEEAKQMRRFYRGALDSPVNDKYHRIRSMTPINDTEYLNAAFLRLDDASEPLRMTDPDGALMIHTSEPGLKGRLMVARVDTTGTIIWQVDTGIDRFKLSQILPGENSFAFVGTRPAIPDKLSEPLLVIVENSTGKVATHSLWQ